MAAASFKDGATERHLFEYRFNGSAYGIEIKAANAEEAEARLKALPWAQYKGRIFATIPAPMGPLVLIGTFLRNVLKSLLSDSRGRSES